MQTRASGDILYVMCMCVCVYVCMYDPTLTEPSRLVLWYSLPSSFPFRKGSCLLSVVLFWFSLLTRYKQV